MRTVDYTSANRAAWNEAAPHHAQHRFAQLLEEVQRPGYCRLDAVERAILEDIDVTGKSVVHLCCNNGQELLSIKGLGAGRCVGFDISEEFIAQARRLAEAGGIDCEFVQSDVYDIPPAYDGQFDLAYISIGALGWMPDLPGFLDVIAWLLRPDGWLFVYEMHPMLDMFDPEQENPPRLKHSYFKGDPFVDTDGIDYVGGSTYESLPMYWFHHKMSDIIQGCLDGGFAIVSFREYSHDISAVFSHFAEYEVRPPMCYSLVARKTEWRERGGRRRMSGSG